jgi:hypothetical protein
MRALVQVSECFKVTFGIAEYSKSQGLMVECVYVDVGNQRTRHFLVSVCVKNIEIVLHGAWTVLHDPEQRNQCMCYSVCYPLQLTENR